MTDYHKLNLKSLLLELSDVYENEDWQSLVAITVILISINKHIYNHYGHNGVSLDNVVSAISGMKDAFYEEDKDRFTSIVGDLKSYIEEISQTGYAVSKYVPHLHVSGLIHIDELGEIFDVDDFDDKHVIIYLRNGGSYDGNTTDFNWSRNLGEDTIDAFKVYS